MDLIIWVWGLLTLVAEGVRCQGVYGECEEANVIVTLCRRWPLVICSESQSGGCARAPTRAPKTLRNTSSREGSGRHVCGSLSGSSTDQITLISGLTRRLGPSDWLIMMKTNVCLDVAAVPFNIHSRALLSCATANLLLISISLDLSLSLSPSLPYTLCLHILLSLTRATSGADGVSGEAPSTNDRCALTVCSTPAPALTSGLQRRLQPKPRLCGGNARSCSERRWRPSEAGGGGGGGPKETMQ